MERPSRTGRARPRAPSDAPRRGAVARRRPRARRTRAGFQLVVTSPRVRALDTARLAGEALGCEQIVDERLTSGFDVHGALELAAAAGEDKRVLFVGHNPDFAEIVGDLTGATIELKKGGIAAVRRHGHRGELIALLRPREIARLG